MYIYIVGILLHVNVFSYMSVYINTRLGRGGGRGEEGSEQRKVTLWSNGKLLHHN